MGSTGINAEGTGSESRSRNGRFGRRKVDRPFNGGTPDLELLGTHVRVDEWLFTVVRGSGSGVRTYLDVFPFKSSV